MADKENFPKIAVRTRTRKQVIILAALQDRPIANLVGEMVDQIWQQALIEGLVNGRMLEEIELTRGRGEDWHTPPAEGVSYIQKVQE